METNLKFEIFNFKLRSLYIILSIVIGLVNITSSTHAQTPSCAALNNGGPACSQNAAFSLNKQVQTPDGKSFQDNLTAASNSFAPGSTVTFRITVRNTGNDTLNNVTVTDTIPGYMDFVKGDGTFDKNSRVFTAKIASLTKGQSKTLNLQTKVATQLPANPSPLCISNQAQAQQGNRTSADTAIVCLNTGRTATPTNTTTRNQPTTTGSTSKGGLPMYNQTNPPKTTPSTGPESIALLGMGISSVAGWYLRRRTGRN